MGCIGRCGIEWRQSPRAAERRGAALFLRINETHSPSNPAAQISVPAFKNDATRDCSYQNPARSCSVSMLPGSMALPAGGALPAGKARHRTSSFPWQTFTNKLAVRSDYDVMTRLPRLLKPLLARLIFTLLS